MQERIMLKNGVRLVCEQMPSVRTVCVGVWMHVGAMMETPAEYGLSHLMEHMAFKGTARRTSQQLAREMDAMGGQINAFTSFDATCFYGRVIDEDLEKILDMLSDITLRPAILAEELDKERGVVLEEITAEEDDPESKVGDILHNRIYAGTPMGHSILGTAEQVSAYTRDDLLRYHAAHYGPRSCVLSVSGHFDRERLIELAEKTFGDWPHDNPPAAVESFTMADGCRVWAEKDIEQLQLEMCWPVFPQGDRRNYAVRVMNNVFGGSLSSRLWQQIREKLGMAYTIASAASVYERCGALRVYAGVSPKNGSRVIDEILRLSEELRTGGVTRQEFDETRHSMRVNFLMSLESSSARMMSMGANETALGQLISPEERLRRMDAVTFDEVNRMAAEIFAHAPSVSAVGRGVSFDDSGALRIRQDA